jgi:DNA (cytosine-5)-methyltransferase 1
MIVDLFAGPGGWSEGLRMVSPELHAAEVGIEWDDAACRTRAAAGHRTVRADVSAYPVKPFMGKVTGLIASPPCTDYSVAGGRAGIDGESGRLVTEVLRWADALRPEWIACEQVPPVLPIWQEYAVTLRSWGYSAWAGILNAADFGVPQTRQRAFLIASRVRAAVPPEPTHAKNPAPSLFGPELLPWVSMADALGWGRTAPAWTLAAGTKSGGADSALMGGSGTRAAVAAERNAGYWTVDRRQNSNDGKGGSVPVALVPMSRPSPTLTGMSGGQWMFSRPATTVCGDPRLGAPGHRDREGGEPQFGEGSVKLTVSEALVLQSFPPDYPVQGTKMKQFEQIGNAVPPRLAAHVITAASGCSAGALRKVQ